MRGGEPCGWSETDDPTLSRLSAGTDVVSVLRHDYACDYFHYAADGIVILMAAGDLHLRQRPSES